MRIKECIEIHPTLIVLGLKQDQNESIVRCQNQILFLMDAPQGTTTRRTRNDPESRDFTCRCGKKYLSYAAVYTHVKQKHNLDKAYLENIGKPPREKQQRGRRPRENKQNEVSSDVEQISILEEAILKMYQLLSTSFERMILEGNDRIDEKTLDNQYRALLNEVGDSDLQSSGNRGRQELKFIQGFSRHFTAEVAARVKLVVHKLCSLDTQGQMMGQLQLKQKLQELNSYDLWSGRNEVNQLIYATFQKWKALELKL